MSNEPEEIVIGDFQVLRQLGAGGMGIVYLARQKSLDRLVALKVLGQALNSQNAIARFKRESTAVAKLKHPSIAGVHYVGQDGKICYMAMEYIDGISLREAIQRLAHSDQPDSSLDAMLQGVDEQMGEIRFDASEEQDTQGYQPTPEPVNPYKSPQAEAVMLSDAHIRRCCEVIRDAALALHYAHEQGVVHRDVKPENIMLSREGNAYVIDFGLARFFEDNTLTHTGQLVGTPLYMSPEQVTARVTLDCRTDIYSLGMVLYELVSLQPPIKAANRETLLATIISKELAPLSHWNKNVGPDLLAVVHQATARDRSRRYQSAEDFAADLRRVLAKERVVARRYVTLDIRFPTDADRPFAAAYSSIATFVYSIWLLGYVLSTLLVSKQQYLVLLPYTVLAGLTACVSIGIWAGRRWAFYVALVFHSAMLAGVFATLVVNELTLSPAWEPFSRFFGLIAYFFPLVVLSASSLLSLSLCWPWISQATVADKRLTDALRD